MAFPVIPRVHRPSRRPARSWVNSDGTFTEVFAPLDWPTSLEFIGNTAYVVTLGGGIWKIDNVGVPSLGASR